MSRTLVLLTLLLSLSFGEGVLRACGDKFFLVGRGERHSRVYAALHPGKVLVYTGGPSEISRNLRNARLHREIGRAGHDVLLASNRTELEQRLRVESIDVIVAEFQQAVDLTEQAAAAPSRPTVLPIMAKSDDPGRSPTPFSTTLKSSDRLRVFLTRIDDVMNARTRRGSPKS